MKKILIIFLSLLLGISAKAEWKYKEIDNTDCLINDQDGFTLIIPVDPESTPPIIFVIDNTENRDIYSLIYTKGDNFFTHIDYLELFFYQSMRSNANIFYVSLVDTYYIKYTLTHGGTLEFSFITKEGIKTFFIEPIMTIN